MVTNVHHVGIAVKSLSQAYRFWRDTLGLPLSREAVVAEQGVRAALLAAGESEIELLEPLSAESAVGRFLAKRGEGLHHICFKTADVASDLTALRARGVPLIDSEPRQGLAGRIGFLHPKACHGVLVELATPSNGETHADITPGEYTQLTGRAGRRGLAGARVANLLLTERLRLTFNVTHALEEPAGGAKFGYLLPGIRLQASF